MRLLTSTALALALCAGASTAVYADDNHDQGDNGGKGHQHGDNGNGGRQHGGNGGGGAAAQGGGGGAQGGGGGGNGGQHHDRVVGQQFIGGQGQGGQGGQGGPGGGGQGGQHHYRGAEVGQPFVGQGGPGGGGQDGQRHYRGAVVGQPFVGQGGPGGGQGGQGGGPDHRRYRDAGQGGQFVGGQGGRNGGNQFNGQRGGNLGEGALQFHQHNLRGRDEGRNWWRNGEFAHEERAERRFHVGAFAYPHGWYYRTWYFGDYLPWGWFTSSYYLDWQDYDLPPPPIGCEWVREGHDALLVDVWTGEILSVYRDMFW